MRPQERRSGPGHHTEAAETSQALTVAVPSSVPPISTLPPGLDGADPRWVADGLRALTDLAGTGRAFTLDELRDEPYDVPEPPHPAAWGGLVRAAASAGTIRRIGYVASTRPSRHSGVVGLWRGARRAVSA